MGGAVRCVAVAQSRPFSASTALKVRGRLRVRWGWLTSVHLVASFLLLLPTLSFIFGVTGDESEKVENAIAVLFGLCGWVLVACLVWLLARAAATPLGTRRALILSIAMLIVGQVFAIAVIRLVSSF